MIGKLVPAESTVGSVFWFMIPEEMQANVQPYLAEVIGEHSGVEVKKKFFRDISNKMIKSPGYSPRIPVQFSNCVAVFYAFEGEWRVGSIQIRNTINDLALKEEILLDINAITMTA